MFQEEFHLVDGFTRFQHIPGNTLEKLNKITVIQLRQPTNEIIKAIYTSASLCKCMNA